VANHDERQMNTSSECSLRPFEQEIDTFFHFLVKLFCAKKLQLFAAKCFARNTLRARNTLETVQDNRRTIN